MVAGASWDPEYWPEVFQGHGSIGSVLMKNATPNI